MDGGNGGGARVYDKVKVQNNYSLVRLDMVVAQEEEVEGQIEEWMKIVANFKNTQSTIYLLFNTGRCVLRKCGFLCNKECF